MAFSSRRGRPRKVAASLENDKGTPELRQKRMLGITVEPIDLCFEKGFITEQQHRSALHLRWLYTLRYGAPSITTRYAERDNQRTPGSVSEDWRIAREQEYAQARDLLQTHRLYEPVMRTAIYNESPAFLNASIMKQATQNIKLAVQLTYLQQQLVNGLDLLSAHWAHAALRQVHHNSSPNR